MPKYVVHTRDRDTGRVLNPSVIEATDGAQAAEQVVRPELQTTLVETYTPAMGSLPAWSETLAAYEKELASRLKETVRERSRQKRRAVLHWVSIPFRASAVQVVATAKRRPLAFSVLLNLTVGLAAWWVVLQSRPLAIHPKSHLATIADVPNSLELVWSPDGERLACVNPGWRLHFDVSVGGMIWSSASEPVQPTVVFPVKVWDATGAVRTSLPGTERVGIVFWNDAGSRLVTVEPKRAPTSWNVGTGQEEGEAPQFERWSGVLKARQEPPYMGTPQFTFEREGKSVKVTGEWHVSSPDGQMIAHAYPYELLFPPKKPQGRVIGSGPSREARVAASALRIIDRAGGEDRLLVQFDWPVAAAWSPNSQRLAVVNKASPDAEIWVCDPQSGQSVLQCEGKIVQPEPGAVGYHAAQVAWSADGKQVTVQADAKYIAWDATTGQRLLEQTFDNDPACVDAETMVYWSPEGRRLAVHTKDGVINLWGPPLWARPLVVFGAALLCLLALVGLCTLPRVSGKSL
ncbi:MAG: hypothetical protein K2R98_23615 [Gemmataceae bacterium]|nr:hypothetical protein [Gemmataceae bacterium]